MSTKFTFSTKLNIEKCLNLIKTNTVEFPQEGFLKQRKAANANMWSGKYFSAINKDNTFRIIPSETFIAPTMTGPGRAIVNGKLEQNSEGTAVSGNVDDGSATWALVGLICMVIVFLIAFVIIQSAFTTFILIAGIFILTMYIVRTSKHKHKKESQTLSYLKSILKAEK